MPPSRLPLFVLPDGKGTLQAFQRQPVAVALLHPEGGCGPCRALGEALAGADLEGAQALVVPLDQAGIARPVAQAAGREAGEPEPLLVVADRFGEVAGAWPVHAPGADAASLVREAADTVRFVEQQCPE